MIHDVLTLGKNEPLEKIEFLKAAESTTDFLSNSLRAHIREEENDVSFCRRELLVADDIMEETKALMKSVLSEVSNRN